MRTPLGFDSEFLPTGLSGDPASVHSVQFSDGEAKHYFLESPRELKMWLNNHHRTVKEIFGFNMLCDLGALKEWLPHSVFVVRHKGKLIGTIRYGSAHIKAYDTEPLLNNFGLRRLEDVGDVVGVPKLVKPPFLGLRKWQTLEEHEQFRSYALTDAIITCKATKWLIEENNCDPRKHASAGSLASDFFSFPKRHKQEHGRVLMPPIERAIGQCTSAGRSEAFTIGYVPSCFYNDVKSLYPLSIFVTRALAIDGVAPCDPSDLLLDYGDLSNPNYGWLAGTFKTNNEMWGLPIPAQNVTYVTGYVMGLFHTFDLCASKSEVVNVTKAYKPIYNRVRLKAHNKFGEMLLKRLEGEMDDREARFSKAVLNSTYGKLGQSHPEATTTNYPAFSTILAHSHFVMSHLFDRCPTEINGMDTDSIFTNVDLSGRYGNLTDGEETVPIIMDVKGRGDLAMFRSKTYMMREEGKPIRVYGRHVWRYFLEDYFTLWDRDDYPFVTRIEVKHTLKTQTKMALKLPLGFWCEKPVKLTEKKISELLQADRKRKRATYDSFKLFRERESQPSTVYHMDEAMFDSEFEYPPKAHELELLRVNRWMTQVVNSI